MNDNNDTFEDKRIRQRRIYHEDLPLIYKWYCDPDLMTFYDAVSFPTANEEIFIDQYWSWLENDAKLGLGGAVLLELKETGRPIGECNWMLIDRTGPESPGVYQVGGLIGVPELHGQGYGTEALRLLCSYLFRRKQAHRLEAITRAFNTGGMKTLVHNAFQREGVLREAVLVDGVWQDRIFWGLLRSEWLDQFKCE